MRAASAIAAALVVLVAGGCHDAERSVSVYFPQRLGPDGPPGQVTPVLEPVARERRRGLDPAWQALVELRQGPSPAERARGFLDALTLGERPLELERRDGAAVVAFVEPPSAIAAAAVVYSLTALEGIDRVGLRVAGRPCCLFRHDGGSDAFTTRARYRFWSAEPCELRTHSTHVRCRRD